MTITEVAKELEDWIEINQHQMTLPTMDVEDLLLKKEVVVKLEILNKLLDCLDTSKE